MEKKTLNKLLKALPPDDKEIRAEFLRLLNLFDDAPEKQMELAGKELSRAAFLAITIDRLEKEIAKNGCEEEYQNGENQKGKKKTVAADLHVSYTKNFLAVMRQLHDVMKQGDGGSAGDAFDNFD